MASPLINKDQLFAFIKRADHVTYAGNGKAEIIPERPGFIELTYAEGDLFYRDSYTGYYRAAGITIVRFKKEPLWYTIYGGGMVPNAGEATMPTFNFLKKALLAPSDKFKSQRGPHIFAENDWEYTYTQDGDVSDFSGYEAITFKRKKVFFHRVSGGIVVPEHSKIFRLEEL